MNKIFFLDIGADFVTKIFDYFADLIYQRLIALLGEFFSAMNATGYDLFGMPWGAMRFQLKRLNTNLIYAECSERIRSVNLEN